MRHLGDITKINGAEIEPVDVISGGSPCQDLSVAGKRNGMSKACPVCGWKAVGNAEETVCPECGHELEYTRSGLFMEQIRIIKEMRKNERDHGRPVQSLRPRYCIFENVPGIFSSNGGKDFQAVLTEFVRVCEPNAPDVPLPDKGKWPKAGALYGVGADGVPFSLAYRLHDAQWWGVPQRRKRLCVLCDFTGYTAAEILFDPQYRRETEDATADETVGDLGGDAGPEVSSFAASLPRYTHPSGETREGTAAGTESGSGGADRALSVDCRNATEGEVQTSLQAKPNGGFSLNCGAVVRVNT